jgi:hypothetical protein
MVAHINIPNIRRIYSRPWRDSGLANPGKIPACVQVGVRPETTLFTHETMLGAFPKLAAMSACLAGASRIDVSNLDAGGGSFVLYKALRLSPGPTVEPGAHPLFRFYPVANMRQILQRHDANSGVHGILDDGFAYFVVYQRHMPPLLAGGLPELPHGALAAVGLETATQGKVAIALLPQGLAAKDLAQAVGGEVDLPNVHSHHGAGRGQFRVVAFDDEIEKSFSFFENEYSLPHMESLAQAAIPPATKVAGFLARIL